jgi:hypothetical protein
LDGAFGLVLKPIFWIDKALDFSHFQKELKFIQFLKDLITLSLRTTNPKKCN